MRHIDSKFFAARKGRGDANLVAPAGWLRKVPSDQGPLFSLTGVELSLTRGSNMKPPNEALRSPRLQPPVSTSRWHTFDARWSCSVVQSVPFAAGLSPDPLTGNRGVNHRASPRPIHRSAAQAHRVCGRSLGPNLMVRRLAIGRTLVGREDIVKMVVPCASLYRQKRLFVRWLAPSPAASPLGLVDLLSPGVAFRASDWLQQSATSPPTHRCDRAIVQVGGTT